MKACIFGHQLPRLTALCAIAFLVPHAEAAGLAELYREARLNDPILAAANAQRESVEALLPQALGQLLPQVSYNLSRSQNDTSNTYSARSDGFNSTVPRGKDVSIDYSYIASSGSLNLTQAVFRPQAWIALAQARVQVRQAEATYRQAEQDLILRLAQAYFDVLLAEDNVSLADEQKAAIAEQLKQAKRYFEAGVGTVTDINEAQARYDTIQAQGIAAQNALEVKVRTLEQVVGNIHRALDRLGTRLLLETPRPDRVDDWVDFSLVNNPVLKASEAALEVAEKEVSKSAAAHLPTVDLFVGRARNENASVSLVNNVDWTDTVGVRVAIPLFAGGATEGRVTQTSALRERARYELESAKRSTVLGARQEFLNVHSGVAQVKALEQSVKSNEVALYSARKGQEAGTRTSFDVLNAQQLLFAAKRDLAQARYTYVNSRLRLRSAAGLLGEEDIELIQRWLEK